MTEIRLNRLAEGLRELCSQHVLEEKFLLAPSHRIGRQWLDAVTMSGQPVLNVRVMTMTGFALQLAAPEMQRLGARFMSAIRGEVLVSRLLAELRGDEIAARKSSVVGGNGRGYFSGLGDRPNLARSAAATLRDLRLAGLIPKNLRPRLFEVAAKGHELAFLLSRYEEELRSHSLVDYADVLRAAAARAKEDDGALPGRTLVILPEDMRDGLRGLERALWEAIPEAMRVVLEVDRPGEDGCGRLSDAALLAWVPHPSHAPFPRGDGTAEIFRAVGEVNEVREVLRRCMERNIPFDEVEILHCDTATYIPLIYELCCSHAREPGEPPPVTFSEGIPVYFSRPGRALAGWLSWIGEGYPQSALVDMLNDGLLQASKEKGVARDHAQMANLLRSIPIGAGRERYLPAIDGHISYLQRLEEHSEASGEGSPPPRRLEPLRRLRDLVSDLLEYSPRDLSDSLALLKGAAAFTQRLARGASELDSYGRKRLLEQVEEMVECLEDWGGWEHLDAMSWLTRLVQSSRVEGQGPRPGCLYVAPLWSGGHSGRPHTFVVGLDDSRFPGPAFQDPFLLDSERERLSGELATAVGGKARRMEEFSSLMARVRGTVTLGYCCRSLEDDRDMFPSPAVLSAYRILSANHAGMMDDLLAWLPPAASFAPHSEAGCLDSAEWWLHHLCRSESGGLSMDSVARAFPHLGRGREARVARESDLFTAYDGYLPEAGADLDPTAPDGPVLSANRLETLGRCPLEYFLRYVLEIEPPRDRPPDPSRWLEPPERGNLLHAVFREFLSRLRREDKRPELERDWGLLLEILEREISFWKAAKPPPNQEVLRAEVEELRRTARIFLQEEELHCRDHKPAYFEASLGMESQGEGSEVDTPDPLPVELPGGRRIRACGRIDRIDEAAGETGQCFVLCDYKTGSAWDYEAGDPFRQGRRVQNALYVELARARLAECHPGCEVLRFEYFFPGTREHGERIGWSCEELAEGRAVMAELCEMLSRGCFPPSDDPKDYVNSDYLMAMGEVERTAERARTKLCNPRNTALAPLRRLRGYREEEDGD